MRYNRPVLAVEMSMQACLGCKFEPVSEVIEELSSSKEPSIAVRSIVDGPFQMVGLRFHQRILNPAHLQQQPSNVLIVGLEDEEFHTGRVVHLHRELVNKSVEVLVLGTAFQNGFYFELTRAVSVLLPLRRTVIGEFMVLLALLRRSLPACIVSSAGLAGYVVFGSVHLANILAVFELASEIAGSVIHHFGDLPLAELDLDIGSLPSCSVDVAIIVELAIFVDGMQFVLFLGFTSR